jgi:hypothetical protein
MSLKQFEKFHRQFFISKPLPPSNKEVLITFLVSIIAAPFLFASLFMIPIIGQVLSLTAFCLTTIYFWVRKSVKITAVIILAYLLFIIPALVTVQFVAVKNRFDVTLFLLIASCIPVSIFYILLVAGRIWFMVESKQDQELTATGA